MIFPKSTLFNTVNFQVDVVIKSTHITFNEVELRTNKYVLYNLLIFGNAPTRLKNNHAYPCIRYTK